MNREIVLASSSPRRSELLRTVGVGCKIVNPSVDESRMGDEIPQEFALRLAVEKALSVARDMEPSCYIIGADTIVVESGSILGKPICADEARSMLFRISGKEHTVLTAFAIVSNKSDVLHNEIVETTVKVKTLAATEIEGYIKTGEPMDKAGAYGIQGIGSFMVESINGSYTNVVGLPVYELLQSLTKLGVFKLF